MHLLTLFSFLLIATAEFAKASVLPINNGTEARLGFGIDTDLDRNFESCIEYDENDLVAEDTHDSTIHDPKSSRSLSVTSEVITSNRQADNYLNESISADVQYLAFSGSGSYGRETKSYSSSDRISVGIKADADYGRWYLAKVKLRPEFARLAAQNISAFYKRCGHEYVAGFKLGQGLSVLMTASNDLNYSYEKIQSSAKAGVGTANLSGSVSASFVSVASELVKLGSLEVHLNSYGSGALSSTEKFLHSTNDVVQFMDLVQKQIADVKSSTAVRVAYLTLPYPIDNNLYNPIYFEYRRSTFLDLFSMFRSLKSDLKRLHGISTDNFIERNQILCREKGPVTCAGYVEYFSLLEQQLETAIEAVGKSAQTCANGTSFTDCRSPELQKLYPALNKPILWPKQFINSLYESYLNRIRGH